MAKMTTSRKVGIGAATGAVLAAAGALITPWEGIYTKPYYDIVGVKTVCIGATAAEGVDLNRDYTIAECKAMLVKSLPKYDDGIRKCVTRDMPDSVRIAMISATYNIGIGGFCKSTMRARINLGDYRGACEALLMWNRAGGRVVKGLDNRRRDERKVCLQGIAQ
jgi:lysozyme